MPDHDLDVTAIADLARLELAPETRDALQGQMKAILGYVEKLGELDLDGIEPTAHPFPRINVTRPDEARPSLAREEALRNAPESANGLFMVPKIVE